MAAVHDLVKKHSLISDQVNPTQVSVILYELERVLRKGLDGDIVEFGCYIGTSSLFIQRLLDASHDTRAFHVYDSFEGLPPKTSEDSSRAGEQFQAGELTVSKKAFLREFQKAHLAPPIIHKGWFGELSAGDVPEHIAFAFLDGDFYSSIRDSLKHILPRMQKGGVIIVDDYAREALPGAAKAVHEVFTPEQVVTVHNLGVIKLS